MTILQDQLLVLRSVRIVTLAAIHLASGEAKVLALESGLVAIMTGKALSRYTVCQQARKLA